MSLVQNRVDFVLFLSVKGANPNGDPLMGNMPRMDRRGYGVMSSVCIKRKIRNRMQDMQQAIAIKTDDRSDDGHHSIKSRVEGVVGKYGKDKDAYKASVCDAFCDYRAFGAILPWKGDKAGDGASIGMTGPITMADAKTVDPIIIESMQIVKSTNSEDAAKRDSSSMGMKHTVEFGLYRIEGTISVAVGQRTGLQESDVEIIKEALRTLCMNDESAARPSGTMYVAKMFWFQHDCAIGQYGSHKVFESVHAVRRPDVEQPEAASDYDIYCDDLPGLNVEVFE